MNGNDKLKCSRKRKIPDENSNLHESVLIIKKNTRLPRGAKRISERPQTSPAVKKPRKPVPSTKSNMGNSSSEEPKPQPPVKPKELVRIFPCSSENSISSTSSVIATCLAENEHISLPLAQSFVQLLDQGCTLPFIARYRKSAVDYLMPSRLQELYESYQQIVTLKKKVKTVLETLKKNNKLTAATEKSVLSARTQSELDLVYAPLKVHSVSLAEKGRKLGLEQYAVKALDNQNINIISLCSNNEELSTPEKVETHITHIVADIIYKDSRVLEQIRILKERTAFILQSSVSKSAETKNDKEPRKNKKSDPDKYKIYFDWKCPVQLIKPHQTLALNRGEDEKVLKVKVVVPDFFLNNLRRFCSSLWRSEFWVQKGLNDAYARLIRPWLERQVRSELTRSAQKEAIASFADNLEKYLLTEPIKNKRIAGLDPGFRAGCKIGVIDKDGRKLDVCTIHPNFKSSMGSDPAATLLKTILKTHSVELIGLGNGTACRETEQWLRQHDISNNIPVVIVPEQGASIYSISKEAQKEHPDMDPNWISALSIARRVLDPLGELIKVDPKNLGVGLYQHDIPQKMMESALDCTVEKIVSLVGVDVNTASQALLRRVAGLNENRAKKIIEYRETKSKLKCREELLNVSGIGKVTFQQCAGFLRIEDGLEPLDATVIHPESYAAANKFANMIGVDIRHMKSPSFPMIVERRTATLNIAEVSQKLKIEVCDLELIINAFKQKKHADNMVSFCKPIYSMAVQKCEELNEGTTLTGVVRNVVPFGCFVDCGVGENGLIHSSKMGGKVLKLGDRVSVTVLTSTVPNKLQLRLNSVL